MGTFEKLGILVIVVIIVMILAFAIYQWGGTGSPAPVTSGEGAGELTIVELERRRTGAPRGVIMPVEDVLGLPVLPGVLLNMLIAIPIYAIMRDLSRWVYPTPEVE